MGEMGNVKWEMRYRNLGKRETSSRFFSSFFCWVGQRDTSTSGVKRTLAANQDLAILVPECKAGTRALIRFTAKMGAMYE